MKIHILVLSLLLIIGTRAILAMEQDPLIQAIAYEDVPGVEAALLKKNPNYFSPADECTPLKLACAVGNAAIVEKLLKAGAGADYHGVNGECKPMPTSTALTVAALNGHVEACKLLIQYGAEINPKNPDNSSPLHAAARNGNAEIIKILIAHGADLNAQNDFGVTALHQTVLTDDKYSHYPAFACLLNAGANPDLQTLYYNQKNQKIYRDKTALMIAAIAGKKRFIDALLLKNANRNILDKDRNIPWKLLPHMAAFAPADPYYGDERY